MFKYFIFFILSCVDLLYARECSSCVAYTACPSALDMATRNENPDIFRNAFCGFDDSQPKVPKMCCDDFPKLITGRIATTNPDECDDCMEYTSCPKALEAYQQRKKQKLFKSSVCGNSQTGQLSKVCCSAFDIEKHPNARLLPDICGEINGKRIVGGVIANLGEFPWMALISHKTTLGLNFQCGGSIINSRYILTAAHCVKDHIIAGVRVGEHDIATAVDCQGSGPNYYCFSHIQDIPVEEKITHESYSTMPHATNDIALLRLADPIDFGHPNVAPICLPVTDQLRSKSLDNKKATVAGWGLIEYEKDVTILRKVDIPILERNICLDRYERTSASTGITKHIDANQFCAGEPNKDSCGGDSGGPLMLEGEYDDAYRIVQYGIVSFGPKRCGSRTPGVYTDVTKYMDWILDNIKE